MLLEFCSVCIDSLLSDSCFVGFLDCRILSFNLCLYSSEVGGNVAFESYNLVACGIELTLDIGQGFFNLGVCTCIFGLNRILASVEECLGLVESGRDFVILIGQINQCVGCGSVGSIDRLEVFEIFAEVFFESLGVSNILVVCLGIFYSTESCKSASAAVISFSYCSAPVQPLSGLALALLKATRTFDIRPSRIEHSAWAVAL